jgi:hypothetical protein
MPKMESVEPSAVATTSNEMATQRPFDSILNFRDVGKIINGFLGEKYVSPFIMFWQPSRLPSTNHPVDAWQRAFGTGQLDLVGFFSENYA